MTLANGLQIAHALAAPRLLLLLAISQVTQVASYYLASKLVVAPRAHLSNALKCYGFVLIAGVAAFVSLLAGLVLFAKMGGLGGWLAIPYVLVWAACVIAALVRGSMRIYQTTAGAALLLLLMGGVANAAVSVPLRWLIRPRADAGALTQLRRLSARMPRATLPGEVTPGTGRSPAPAPDSRSSRAGFIGKLEAAVGKAAPEKPAPGEAVLLVDTRFPVVLDGRVAGDVLVDRGTHLELLGVHGDKAKVKYMNSVVEIPKSRIDY